MHTRYIALLGAVLSAAALVVGCGGGVGSGGGLVDLGGTVSGLSPHAQLVLRNSLGVVTVSANGTFDFGQVGNGALYNVQVAAQPNGQTCTVANGAGTVTGNVNSIAVTCVRVAGSFAYAVNNLGSSAQGTLTGYRMTAGVLSALGGINFPVAVGINPSTVAIDPSGTYLYVANAPVGVAGSISTYRIASGTGLLTSLGSVATGVNPVSIAIDPNGQNAYVVNQGSDTVSTYAIANGVLTLLGSVATGSGPTTIALDPTSTHAYVTNYGGATVSVYSIMHPSGILQDNSTPYSVPALAGGGNVANPAAIALGAVGTSLYTSNALDGSVSAMQSDSSGALSGVGTTTAAGLGARTLAVDPNGKYVLVLNADDWTFSLYAINSTTGVLTTTAAAVPLATAQDHLATLTLDPTGAYAYVTDQASGTVERYAVDPVGGTVTHLDSQSAFNAVAFVTTIGPH